MLHRSTKLLTTGLLLLALCAPAAVAGSQTPPGAAAAATALATDVTDLSLDVLPGGTATATIAVSAAAATEIRVSSDQDWLVASPITFKGGASLAVTASGAGMSPGDVRVGTITIDGGASGTALIPVVLKATLADHVALMAANPTRIDLGTVEPDKTIVQRLTLDFAVPMSGVISTDAGWLDVTPRLFTNTTRQVVLVTIRTNNMIRGDVRTANIEIRSGDRPTLQVPVIINVGNPAPPKRVLKSSFRDVPDDHWAVEAIMTLAELKVISGVGNALYAPDQLVTREQFAKLLVGALRLPLKPAPANAAYADVPSDRWSAAYVETVKQFLSGYSDGLFRPEAPATREDMAAALVKAKGFDKEPPADPSTLNVLFSDAASISVGMRQSVAVAVSKGLVKGFDDGTFWPQAPLTRAQAAVLLYRASQVGGNDKL